VLRAFVTLALQAAPAHPLLGVAVEGRVGGRVASRGYRSLPSPLAASGVDPPPQALLLSSRRLPEGD
jgi:hypothetical protein